MNYLELKHYFLKQMANVYPSKETESFFYILCQHFLKINRTNFLLEPNTKIDRITLEKFDSALLQLKKEVPIQYITGQTEFYGLNFMVNHNVLIPRPETEELVDWIIKDKANQQEQHKILDIGTGSGCIAVSLAKYYKNSTIYAIDISTKALEIAKTNAKTHCVNIQFFQKDILAENLNLNGLDVIVSNPPYVRQLEKKHMNNNVLLHEPSIALFVEDDNPLIFYDNIAQFASKNLKHQGWLYLEINEFLGNDTIALLKEKGFENIILKKDIFGVDRMIKAQKK